MNRKLLIGACAALLTGILVAVAVWVMTPVPKAPVIELPALREAPTEAPTPWREPEADLKRFFPGATAHREEARILSAHRPELQRRLKRPPGNEEHLFTYFSILKGEAPLGSVIVRRVKGAGGAIELVIPVDTRGKLLGLRIQRHREPDQVARLIGAPAWLDRFKGRSAQGEWPQLPADPQTAAPAGEIVRSARSALIVLELAQEKGIPAAPEAHH